ncbi:hypothetical protein AVEN_198305-1, partial [Araneus ventricosus]
MILGLMAIGEYVLSDKTLLDNGQRSRCPSADEVPKPHASRSGVVSGQ